MLESYRHLCGYSLQRAYVYRLEGVEPNAFRIQDSYHRVVYLDWSGKEAPHGRPGVALDGNVIITVRGNCHIGHQERRIRTQAFPNQGRSDSYALPEV